MVVSVIYSDIFIIFTLFHQIFSNEYKLCPNNLPRNQYMTTYNGYCYVFHPNYRNWDSAQNECQKEGGNLASMSNSADRTKIENEIQSRLSGSSKVWGGARYQSGTWRWSNGEYMSYTYWDSGQPQAGEDCLVIRLDINGRWHDYPCGSFYFPFVCEYHFRECNNDPCDKGTCTDYVNGYTCTCYPGYQGSQCQTEIDECAVDPCENGDCNDAINGYDCLCYDGYTGGDCDEEANECDSNPCLHGSCTDLFNKFTCTCFPGYTGVVCETDINECVSSPCFYGSCNDQVNSYSCTCLPGYTGTRCEIEINECQSSPCKHGYCHDLINSYNCTCYLGYLGNDCDILDLELQQEYMDPAENETISCTDKINYYGKLESQTLECLSDTRDSLMKVEGVGGLIDDIMDTEIINDFFRVPPQSLNEACRDLRNSSQIISVVYHSARPNGSDYHEFNLGLVSSEIKTLQESFCPVIQDIDILIDPYNIIIKQNETLNTTYVYSSGWEGLVIISFCAPLNDTCTATVSNSKRTLEIHIDSSRNELNCTDMSVSVSLYENRVYIFYDGFVESSDIDMLCSSTVFIFSNDSCNTNYGLVTTSPESKNLNKSNGGWETNEKSKVLGLHEGKIMFRSQFFNTDGFNLFIILPEPIRFNEIFSDFGGKLKDSYIVLAVLLSLLVVLTMLTIFTIRLDRRDVQNDRYHCVREIEDTDAAAYCVAIQTSPFSTAHFTHPLFIQIQGFYASCEAKAINFCYDGIVDLKKWTTTYMLLTTKVPLGPIINLRLWTDVACASVMIDKIIIQEVGEKLCHVFILNDWISRDRGSCKQQYNLMSSSNLLREEYFLYPHFCKIKLTEDILPFSILIRPTYDRYTRTQKLYTLAAILAISMLTSAMWYNTYPKVPGYGVKVGPVTINYKQIITGLMASVVSVPPILLITQCFKYHKPEKTNISHYLDIFQRDQKKRQTYLTIGTWIFVLCTIVASAFIIFMYSLQWGGNLSQEWLVSILFGILSDTAIGPIKIVVVCALITRFLKQQAVTDTFRMAPLNIVCEKKHIDKLPRSEWRWIENDRKSKNAEGANLDRIFYIKCRRIIVALCFIAIMVVLASHDSQTTAYRQNSHLLIQLKSSITVKKVEDIGLWLQNVFVPLMNHTRNGIEDPSESFMAADGTTFTIGRARIQQSRMRRSPKCLSLANYQLFDTICDLSQEEESRNFCAGWNVSTAKCTEHHWFTYRNDESFLTYNVHGQFGYYSNKGYNIDFDLHRDNISAVIHQIQQYSWWDSQTRFVSVECAVTNPSSKLFSMVTFRWEFGSFGSVLTYHRILSARLYPYVDAYDYFVLILQCLFIAITLIRIVLFLYDMFLLRPGVLDHLLPICSLVLTITAISFYIYRIDRTIYAIETTFNNKDQFLSFSHLVFLDELYRVSIGTIIFLHTIGILKHLSFNQHLYLLHSTIRRAKGSLCSAATMIVIGITAFASLEYLYSGKKTFAYRDMYNSLSALMCSTVSMAKLSINSGREQTPMNNIVFVSFSFLVNFILINLLVSILNDTLAILKAKDQNKSSYFSFNQYIMKKLEQIFSQCKGSKYHKKEINTLDKPLPNMFPQEETKIQDFCTFVENKYLKNGLSRWIYGSEKK